MESCQNHFWHALIESSSFFGSDHTLVHHLHRIATRHTFLSMPLRSFLAGRGGTVHRHALRLPLGLFVLLTVGSNVFMIIQFHWRERGMHLPSEEDLGHEIVGFGLPPPRQSEHENKSEQSSSNQTIIGSSPQKQNEAREKWLRILVENGTKLLPKPIGWERYGYYRIRYHFNCDGLDIDARPLPTMRDWNIYRSLFGTIVDEQSTFDDSVPPTEGYTLNEDGPPPYYAAHGTRGRGLFASRDIQKGDLVHGSKSDVIFPDAMTWRRYVFSLPRRMACDAIDWTWTQKRGIRTCMNIAILMNAANWKTENQTEPNLSASAEMYATRDIKKGEELLYDYESGDKEWESVGL